MLCAPEPEFLSQARAIERDVPSMLWTIFVILLVLWLLGFTLHIAGGLIHILLVVALVVLVINLVSGRRSVL
jgi:Ca2+/Na+ antiporter